MHSIVRMDEDSESVKLVTSHYANRKAKSKNKRDYDSLNNFMVGDSDSESVQQYGASGCRGEKEIDGDLQTFSESSGKKIRFKDELKKHKSIMERDSDDVSIETESSYKQVSKKSIWRSFLSLCIGLLFAFMSFMPLRNIQTSLYPRNHLANVSLASMYFCFAVGCVLSSWITQNSRPKAMILVAMFGHVVYAAANIYPSMYTLIPSSCFFGFFHAPMWSTHELLIASYGASYTAITRIGLDKSIQQFQGVFLVFCHAAQIFGNLLESTILHCGEIDDIPNTPLNSSLYHSAEDYDRYQNHLKIDNFTERKVKELVWIGPFGYRIHPDMNYPYDKINYENVIKFVFLALAAIGMTTVCLFLNKPDIIIQKRKALLCEKLKDIGGFLKTGLFFALFLLMLFSGMQQAVVICNVTKIYGTLTLGLSMVGYMMMCYGTCQLATLLVVEKLHLRLKPMVAILNGDSICSSCCSFCWWVENAQKRTLFSYCFWTVEVSNHKGYQWTVPTLCLRYWFTRVLEAAFLITLGLLVWLYIWSPSSESLYKILAYVGIWGAVDGLWQSQVQGIILASSVGRREAAVVVFRTVQSLGLVLVFLMDIWLTLLTQICISGAILVCGVITYMIMEVFRSPASPVESFPYAL